MVVRRAGARARRTTSLLALLLALAWVLTLVVGARPATAAAPAGAAVSPTTPPASILVFGGTGRLGSEIARELVARGHEVTVFARPSSGRERLDGLRIRIVEGDALQDDDVRRALETRRFDVVVDALGRSESPPSFFAITGRSIARWSKQTGVRQVILHGSVGVGDSRDAWPGTPVGTLGEVLKAKEVAEQALVDSGVPYTIIRNGSLRSGPASPRAVLVEDPRAMGPVSRASLARLTADCVLQPRCLGRRFHGLDAPPAPD